MADQQLKSCKGASDETLRVVGMAFGHGTNITGEIANFQKAILNYDRMVADDQIELDEYAEQKSIKIDGRDYSEMNTDLNNKFSLSSNFIFKNSLSITTKEKTHNINKYEYAGRILLNKKVGATIHSESTIKQYLLDDVKKELNGLPNSLGVIAYPSDNNGLTRLFDTYGTHVITRAIFGSKLEYYRMRELLIYNTDMSQVIDYALNAKYSGDPKGVGAFNLDSGNTNTQVSTEIKETEFGVEVEKRAGGDSATDITSWLESCTLNNLQTIALVGYTIKQNEANNGLIPLWDLVDDSARKQAMKTAYDAYLASRTEEIVACKQVIADVCGILYGKGENAPESKYMDDFRGKKRNFLRLDDNIMGHVRGTTKGSFYFYYALGYASDCGLTDIKFVHEKEPNGSDLVRRGNHANENVTGCLDNNVIAIVPAQLKDGKPCVSEDKLISGFGLKIENNVSKISKGTLSNFPWTTSGCDWYKGLAHDKVHCVHTTKTLVDI